jgi:triacylglycerol lipase
MMEPRVTTPALASSAHGSGRPILLIHGFLATPRVVGSLAARLGRLGYCAHDVDLGGIFGRFNARPVEYLAHVVAERVEQLARDHRCERIDLVGHSEGGLIGRYYVQKLGGASRVSHLITLGTPHRGTRWAYSGHLVAYVMPSLRQMAPGSTVLRDLADDRFPASVRLTSIYSSRDSICPPSSCRLDVWRAQHLKNLELTRGGHLDLLFSAGISSLVHRELATVDAPVAVRPRITGDATFRPPATANADRRRSLAHRERAVA